MNNALTLPPSAGFGAPVPQPPRQAAAVAECAGFVDLPPPALNLSSLPGRRRRPLAVAAMVAVHLLLLWALANLDRVQQVVREHAPLFVRLVSVSTPQVQTPAELPMPPAPQRPPALAIELPPLPVVANAITVETAQPATATVAAAEPVRGAPASAVVVAAVVATPPLPAPQAAPPTPRAIPSAGVQFTEPPLVEYPKASKRNGEAGTVVVRAYVGAEGGAPRSVQIEQSCGFVRLDQAALAAVQRARFKPYVENGRAVEGFALIPIRFELER